MAASECGFRASLALLFVSALTLGAARQRSLVPQMCAVTVAKRTLPYSGSGHCPPRGHYIMCGLRLVDADVPARGPGARCGLSVHAHDPRVLCGPIGSRKGLTERNGHLAKNGAGDAPDQTALHA